MKALLLVLVPSLAFAQPKVAAVLDDLATVHQFEQVAISDDGKRVAWVEDIIEKGRDTGRAAVYAMDVASKRPATRIGEGRHIAWSHDGKRLAFIDTQLNVATIGGGTKKLTKLDGYKTDPRGPPTASKSRFCSPKMRPAAEAAFAEPVETGVIGGEIHNQRLTIVDVAATTAKQIRPPTSTSTNTTGPPTAARSRRPRRPAPATTTGGSRNSTRCRSRPER